ncbi:MAG: DUF3459 domain-containing protein, partial [Casimicrobiaceae bacterium]
AEAVRAGRLREFARFARFSGADTAAIPDPQAPETYARSKLDWGSGVLAPHARWLALYRELLGIRRRVVTPIVAGLDPRRCGFERTGARSLAVHWCGGDGVVLELAANLGAAPDIRAPVPPGRIIYTTGGTAAEALAAPWSATWALASPALDSLRP